MDSVPYLGAQLTRWQVGRSTFLALPEKGARLMNWHLTLADGSVRDILYWPELSSLDDWSRVRGGNPILFPFAGRSFAEGETDHWLANDGVRRPMPRHGLARQGAFKLVSRDARGFVAQFQPDEAARGCYPFDYEFVVTYRFESLALSCEFQLRNFGEQPIPWRAGHHFYFTVPWSEGLNRADYLIQLPANRRLRQDATGRLVEGPELSREVPLTDPGLQDTIHADLRGSTAVFGEKDRPGDISVQIGTTRQAPAGAVFLTWTEHPESPFYCVEPWMGPPGAAASSLPLVHPGQTGKFTVSVQVH